MKVMLDTNILVSMLFFPSYRTRSFAKAITPHTIVIAQYTIDELYCVANEKFPKAADMIERLLNDLSYELLQTAKNEVQEGIPEIRDIKDVPILAAAILERVDVLVTGDKDFLVLQTERPEIMTMAGFEEKYGTQ